MISGETFSYYRFYLFCRVCGCPRLKCTGGIFEGPRFDEDPEGVPGRSSDAADV